MIDNPNDPAFADILRRLHALETATPTGYTSVTNGSLRILSEEGFYVGEDASAFIDGLLKVLGRLELTGDFILSGDTDATGNWVQSGSFKLTGPFTVEGNTSMTGNFMSTGEFTLTGPFHINGATDLNGTMTVHPSGKIVIEGTVPLEIANGAITAGVAEITFVTGLGMVMRSGANTVGVGLGGATLGSGGETAGMNVLGVFYSTGKAEFADDLSVDGDEVVAGDITGKQGLNLPFLPTMTGVTPNLYIDSATGIVYQVV